ncbi:MAG: hypothetical protein KAT06_06310 [Gammaproteobacteria bacterium]|nr:hypothetical protein [Gammaproteobacteria bacterium]
MSLREYVFQFDDVGIVSRIPYAKWCRVLEGEASIDAFANQSIYIAYAYILVENRIPNYCPRIDGAIYYFDEMGYVILGRPFYFDLLQDLEEYAGGAINLQHRKNKKAIAEKYRWKLKPNQIQQVIDYIWS